VRRVGLFCYDLRISTSSASNVRVTNYCIYQEFSAFAKKAKMFEWLWGWFKPPDDVSNLSEEELALLNIEKPEKVFNFSKVKSMLSDPFQTL